MTATIIQMATLFLIMAAGYAANKFKIMTEESNRLVSKLVVNIAMPCTILGSVLGGQTAASNMDAVYFLLLSFGAFLMAFIVSWPLPRILRVRERDGGMYRYMAVFGNVGFMGFPVIQSVFGSGAVFYVMLFNIAFNVLCFSAGIIIVSGKGGKINPKLFINPTMVVSLLTVIIFFTKLQLPEVFVNAVDLVSKMTTPAAMLVLGSTLACIPVKEVFSELRIYPLAAVKLLVIPVLARLVFGLVISDRVALGVLVALSAMPTATNTAMLSMEYGGNEKLASKGVFLTTLFSVATIPLLLFILFP